LKCSIIYGGLPPEVRRQQSLQFNNSNTSNRILVATDAIGMGLNLNIRRVIFSSLLKFDGKETRALTPSQVSSKLDGKFFMVLIFII
jgi:ATP-dependent RNA helicase SUPV3L1/SUV3